MKKEGILKRYLELKCCETKTMDDTTKKDKNIIQCDECLYFVHFSCQDYNYAQYNKISKSKKVKFIQTINKLKIFKCF